MNSFDSFQCPECGGNVDLRTGTERTMLFRHGIEMAIPDDFLIPTCDKCEEQYTTPDIEKEMERRCREMRVLVRVMQFERCKCSFCLDGKKELCEYKIHHCDECHELGGCTLSECGFVRK